MRRPRIPPGQRIWNVETITHLYFLLPINRDPGASRQDHHRSEVGVQPVPETRLAAPGIAYATP
jgi:hypothetical protein